MDNLSAKYQAIEVSVPSIQSPATSQNETSYTASTTDRATTMRSSNPTILLSTKENEVYNSDTTLISPSPTISPSQYEGLGNSR